MTIVDTFSNFVWLHALVDKSGASVTDKLMETMMSVGPPNKLHSDNGSQFGAYMQETVRRLFPDVNILHGRPYHPQSQGCVERLNGIVSELIAKRMACKSKTQQRKIYWDDYLKQVQLVVNTRVSQRTGFSPMEILMGRKPDAPGFAVPFSKEQASCILTLLNCRL